MMLDLSVGDYAVVPRTFCDGPDGLKGKDYDTLESAKDACDGLPSCEAFYTKDKQMYSTCPFGSKVKISEQFKLYKKGNLLQNCCWPYVTKNHKL